MTRTAVTMRLRLVRLFVSSVVVMGAVALGLAVASPARAQIFNPETMTLANGLTVVAIPNHRAPIVTQMVWYRVGAGDEVPGKSGIAHFLEHLMFKGTKAVPPGEFSKIIAHNGGPRNPLPTHSFTPPFPNNPPAPPA